MNPITFKRHDLIKGISNKLNMNYAESKIILESVLGSFEDLFIKENDKSRIEIRGFGVFNIYKTRKRTNARNPITKKTVIIPPRKKIVFKPSKKINEILNKTDMKDNSE